MICKRSLTDPPPTSRAACLIKGRDPQNLRFGRPGYHVLGGTLSALDGRRPEDLFISALITRAKSSEISEIILATSATVDGQTTAHYLADRLAETGVSVSRPAHGLPVGGELDYLDDGTLSAALEARQDF